MRNRVIIENVTPSIDGGRYFIKRIIGERISVSADVFSDGHDAIRASLLYKQKKHKKWTEVFMEDQANDVWIASFIPEEKGMYEYKIEAWVDHLLNWYNGFKKKHADGQHMSIELAIGADLLKKTAKNYPKTKGSQFKKLVKILENKKAYDDAISTVLGKDFGQLVHDFPFKQFESYSDQVYQARVGRKKELFSTWYEIFPRSTSLNPGEHGTFKDCERLLPRIKKMGFDVLYFPPIHPIGKLNRKGKNNSVIAEAVDPGSPWAIGSEEGGHKSIHKELGTLEDYKNLLKAAKKHGLEIALDIAFQCAPDHPYVKEHPNWFIWRPDGTIMYAENPPKKYQDIVPINFETEDWKNLWEELKNVILYWSKIGVSIFRVDNPHTKPFQFWEWVITEVHKEYPDTIFLSEAFTRPKVMANLAKVGFTQSYTYYTWRNNKKELEEYMTELTQTELREYFRPNFWPNTPDILAYELMEAKSNAFVLRLAMAATLSSNYGIYGPAYEFMENSGNSNGKEEYQDSEKYETRYYDWSHKNRLTDIITKINHIRRDNPALQSTWNIHFTRTDNEQLMSFIKLTEDRNNIIWVIANFDTRYKQVGFVEVPKDLLGLKGAVNLQVTDLLTEESYRWFNDWNYVELNPDHYPIHIFKVSI